MSDPKTIAQCHGEDLSEAALNIQKLAGRGPLKVSVRELYNGRSRTLGNLSEAECNQPLAKGPQGVAAALSQLAAISHGVDSKDPMVRIPAIRVLNQRFFDGLRSSFNTGDQGMQISLSPVSDPKRILQCRGENIDEVLANLASLAGQGPLRLSIHELYNGRDHDIGTLDEDTCQEALAEGPKAVASLISQEVELSRHLHTEPALVSLPMD